MLDPQTRSVGDLLKLNLYGVFGERAPLAALWLPDGVFVNPDDRYCVSMRATGVSMHCESSSPDATSPPEERRKRCTVSIASRGATG